MKNLLLRNLSTSFGVLLLSVSCFAQDAWNPSENGGFGNTQNHRVSCMIPFKGNIYAGTGDQTANLMQSPSGSPGSFTNVLSDGMYSEIDALATTAEGAGFMYVSKFNSSMGANQIFRSVDGATFTNYFQNPDRVNHIVPFKGLGTVDSIYLFDDNYYGTRIFRAAYNSNDPLDTLATWDTLFDFNTVSVYMRANSTIVHNGKLYVGMNNGAQLYSSANGTSWIRNDSVGNGFGNPNNQTITALGSFGGYLYVGTGNNTDGAQIWRSNNDLTWTMVAQYSGYNTVSAMTTAGGFLWASLSSSSSFGMIVKSSDGVLFTNSNNNGFGIPNNDGNYGNFATFNNNIYFGSENFGGMVAIHSAPGTDALRGGGYSTGGEIWRACLGVPPTINLGADQTVCQGVSVTFDAGPGAVSYLWCDGSTTQTITKDTAGVYTCTILGSNGCYNADTVRLNNNPSPTVMFSTAPHSAAAPPPSILCLGDSLDVFGSASSNVRNPLAPIHRSTNAPILDYATILDSILVTGVGDFANASLYSVTIDSLYHTYDNDMVISLVAPDGSTIDLSTNHGSSGDNYMNTSFSPTATAAINSGVPPFTGSYTPDTPFANLSGMADGNWAMKIYDVAGGDQGVLKGWTIRFSQADTMLTFSWSPATGLTSTTTLNTTAFPTASAVYALTTTNSIGCSSIDSLHIVVPKLILPPSHTVCFGKSTTLTASGGSMYYWSPATDLNTTLGSTVIATLSASRMYYVTDTAFGCPLKDSLMLTLNPATSVSSTGSQTICTGDTVSLFATAFGGTAPYTYVWTDSISTFTTPVVTVTPTATGTFTVTSTDAHGCAAYNSANITLVPSTDIYGHVSYSGGPILNATAVIYKYLPYLTHFDTVQTVAVNAITGDYHFIGINHGDFLIEVFADTAMYPTLVPTYYGNKFMWDSATVVSHFCSMTDTLNIAMVEEVGTAGGIGLLYGQILEGPGYHSMQAVGDVRSPGDPVPGIDVKLGHNPGGQMVTHTTTNSSGNYTFDNLAYNAAGDSYRVYVDIPGLGQDSSYVVTLTAANSQYLNLDYYVDSSHIYIIGSTATAVTNSTSENTNFSVYPNPSKGNATVEYTINSDAQVTLGIYNVLGIKVAELVNTKESAGTYKVNVNSKNNNLSNGVYFISLITNGKTSIHKIVITE